MKIVDVAEFYSPLGGGVRTYVDHKLALARRSGHQVTILAPGPSTLREQRPGGEIQWLESPVERFDHRYHRFNDMAVLWRALDREAPDVVEASSLWTGARALAAWQGSAAKALVMHQDPVAVYPHSLFDRWLKPATIDRLCHPFWRYLRRLSAPFDAVVTSGQWLADRLARHGVRNLKVVPFGIERSAFGHRFASRAVRAGMLAACGQDAPDARLLVAVCRHHPEKRIGTLIEAVNLASARMPLGLYLIGDGPFRRQVERQAARVRHVHVAGAERDRQRLAACMASADALLHGGAAETFGLVVGEALVSGLPLVVPDRGGAHALAGPAWAEAYAAGSASAAADAILRLFTAGRLEYARKAAILAGERLTMMDQHFEGLFSLYTTLSGLAPGAPHDMPSATVA